MTALSKTQVVTGLRGFAAMVFTIAASPVLHEAGVSFQVISLGFGILYSILALAEIPTGVWADLFGARKSTIIGGVLQALSLVILSFEPSTPLQVIIGFALYGLGSSFVSGALSALLFGTNKEQDGEKFNSNRYFSKTEKAAVASYILASASVGFLTEEMGRGAFLVAGLVYFCAALFVAACVQNLPPTREFHSARKEFFVRIGEGFAAIRESIQLQTLLPVRVLHQIETILGVLWLPWIKNLGNGDSRWFSLLATVSYLLRYLVNHYFSTQDRPVSYMPRIAFSLACMAIGSLLCVLGENIWMALFGIWTIAGARGAFLPAVQAIQHEEFPDRVRTTGLSVMNFSTEAIFAVSYFLSAAIINQISIQTAWSITALSFLVAAVLTFRVQYKE